ncbi:unnamed protein product [Hymenolepis diminuta]|uniref:Uncharacterized protein n=1 Tax=Hymenolepis diminuta TaxID=6216 RepID=A0A564YAE8_HYMDI|nr:unnamed protein product [Hymenolepis diminuta]
MSKRVHRFSPFYNFLITLKKHICAHALARLYSNDSYEATLVFHTRTTHTGQLRPLHLLSSSACRSLSLCYSFQTRCGFLENIFGLINPWYSASQSLLALTQTATNWRLLLLSLFVAANRYLLSNSNSLHFCNTVENHSCDLQQSSFPLCKIPSKTQNSSNA